MYKYEIHTHTSEVSRCGKISGVELARYFSASGFDGLCVTDHFLNGNTTVGDDMSWEERIASFCEGYRNTLEEGRGLGLDVFFGWEYSHRGTDLLTYGLDEEWLLRNPGLLDLHVNDYCDLVREEGGFIVHAHPFREDRHIDMLRLLPRKVDAVEVFNVNRSEFENRLADEYADNYNLLKVAGSDTHSDRQKFLWSTLLPRRPQNAADLFTMVREKQAGMLCVSPPAGASPGGDGGS